MSYTVDILPVLNSSGRYNIYNLSPLELVELQKGITALNKNRESNRKYQRNKVGSTSGVSRSIALNLILPFNNAPEQPQREYSFPCEQPQPITLNIIKP